MDSKFFWTEMNWMIPISCDRDVGLIIIIMMHIYHVLINAPSTHMIHINLNMIFCTHVEHSPTKTIPAFRYFFFKLLNNKKKRSTKSFSQGLWLIDHIDLPFTSTTTDTWLITYISFSISPCMLTCSLLEDIQLKHSPAEWEWNDWRVNIRTLSGLAILKSSVV